MDRDHLVARIETVRDMVSRVIRELSADALDDTYPEPYDGAPLSTRQFLIHLLAHLNYHLGQVDYLRRMTTGLGAISLATL